MPSVPQSSSTAPKRGQIDRIGVRVLEEMVEMIVTGAVGIGEFFPPEQTLCDEFGVSRTVVRECIKRIQEKGLVRVASGRRTQVQPFDAWNVLDPDVFDALVRHDESLGVLDEVSVLRAAVEGTMAKTAAETADDASITALRESLHDMRNSASFDEFVEADLRFHLGIMELSKNRMGGAIARSLFVRSRASSRYTGNTSADHLQMTLAEHEAVFAAIENADADAARAAMEEHILGSWRRRRFPDGEHHLNP